jgi:hypothetical protein
MSKLRRSNMMRALILYFILIMISFFSFQESSLARSQTQCHALCDSLNLELNSNEKSKLDLLEIQASNKEFLETLDFGKSPQKSGALSNLKIATKRLSALAQARKVIQSKRKMHRCDYCDPSSLRIHLDSKTR